MSAQLRSPRRLAGLRLVGFTVAALALPLLAPTCSGQQPGNKAFSKGSIVIPMDACYQRTNNTSPGPGCPTNGAVTFDNGDVIKAYGLVYQLLRNNIPVYWIINPAKSTAGDPQYGLRGVDLTISLAGGAPVGKYVWADGSMGAMPPNNGTTTISYKGGPFVVDASDFAAANAVLQQAAIKSVFSTVNVHVSGVAFQGYAAKVLSGGWNAGGSNPPKLALLNIPGGDGRYADHVLEGYLIKSGLAPACVLNNPPCADPSAGTATPTGHGNIYDRLEAADFVPPACTAATAATDCAAGSACLTDTDPPAACPSVPSVCHCDWKSTNLARYGYKVLWLPHWKGPGSCEGALCPSATGCSDYHCGATGGCGLVGGDACSCVTCDGPAVSPGELELILRTAGGFVAAQNDVFGECAGIGTLEGVFDAGTATVDATFADGNPASRFHTSAATFPSGGGLHITISVIAPSCSTGAGGMDCVSFGAGDPGELYQPSFYASPFLQLGDYPFDPAGGAITEWRPASGNGATGYVSGVSSLISRMCSSGSTSQICPSGTTRLDYFTLRPAGTGHGNVVYLGGHDYSGNQGTFQVAGTRLVLNTLFNLASACAVTGTPCNTGLLGACSQGTMDCDASGNPICSQTVFPAAEACNGIDDDCNGVVDDNVPADQTPTGTAACFTAPAPAQAGQGPCRTGTWVCQQPFDPAEKWICVGEVGPQPETCNGIDDDCNGVVDDGVPPPDGVSACYTGPSTTRNRGICHDGSWTCGAGSWVCQGEQLPQPESCEPAGTDENCDGQVDENCACVAGTVQPCYSGTPGTAGIGACRAGEQTCQADGHWGPCAGEVTPGTEICVPAGIDENCDGAVDEVCGGVCPDPPTRPCYTGASGCSPDGSGGFTCTGVCAAGLERCAGGTWSGVCEGQVTPGVELCNGKDDDCDGTVDDSAACSSGLACLNGVCTYPTWGTEASCGTGYDRPACTAATQATDCPAGSTCVTRDDPAVPCPAGSTTCFCNVCAPVPCPAEPCPAGQVCQGTTCSDPCAGTNCAPGSFCSGGVCTGGGCYAVACPAGQLCRDGVCVADACSGVSCPAGTFCRLGDCVQACAFVNCPVGMRCGYDGFCVSDPCIGVTCGAGKICQGGGCVDDPCTGQSCGQGQVCANGRCIDDPCTGISCPAGQCLSGQCYASNNPTGVGRPPPATTTATKEKGGCGCGGGEAGPGALLLLLGLPLARRRRGRARGAPPTVLLLAGVLAALSVSACHKSKSAPTNPDGTPCETCGTDACVDVKFDAAHCASCGHACDAGQICVDSVCGPGSLVAPFIQSVTPNPVAAATTPTFTITGERFQSGATLRLAGAVTPVEVTTTFVSLTQLTVTQDLGSAATGTLQMRVVNPDRTVSNAYGVTVGSPTPVISGISPSSALAGTQPVVTVTGTGFTPSSICLQIVPGQPVAGVPTTAGSGSLSCALDLRLVPPGAIQISVQNDGPIVSAPANFDVTAGNPTLDSVSPNTAQPGDQPRLLVTGSGFVPGAVVQFGSAGTFRNLVTTYVAPTRLQAELSLSADPPGSYEVRVSNGGGTVPTGTLPFTVNPTAPTATGLTVTPAQPVIGGGNATLYFTGTGFAATCTVQVHQPGGTFADASTVPPASSTAIQGSTAISGIAGTWYGRVHCPLGDTAAFPFQVQSNVAALSAVTPAGGQQGTTVSFTVAGTNFQDLATLRLTPAGPRQPTVSSVTPSSISASIDLSGFAAAAYVLTAANPGAPDSNGLAFVVTPGVPALSSTATSGSGCTASTCSAACAVQSPTPVTVTLTGTNFAPASTVRASSSLVTDIDVATISGTTVTVESQTVITISLDTTAVVPDSYTFAVWNPGPSGPLKSPSPLPYRIATSSCP